jgi:putative transposase
MKRGTSKTYEPNATYFLTTTVTKFTLIFYKIELAEIFLANLNFYLKDFKARLHAFVIMPNHIHLLASMGEKGNVSQLMGRIKEFSAKQIIAWCKQNNEKILLKIFSDSAKKYQPDQKYQIWQARFDDVQIWSDKVFGDKFDYIHDNPLQEQWRLVDSPEKYRFSSAAFYVDGSNIGVPINPE